MQDRENDVVRRFYGDLWNLHRQDDAEVLLHTDLVFRGSLGDTVYGIAGFLEYQRRVWTAFDCFHNEVVELVDGVDRAAARLVYTGVHVGEVLGLPATGRRFRYEGGAFFDVDEGRIRRAWVIGDLYGLHAMLSDPIPSE